VPTSAKAVNEFNARAKPKVNVIGWYFIRSLLLLLEALKASLEKDALPRTKVCQRNAKEM
jgi:hypothetical protein